MVEEEPVRVLVERQGHRTLAEREDRHRTARLEGLELILVPVIQALMVQEGPVVQGRQHQPQESAERAVME